jgi:O-antigen/teichoic acid export membrane protein
MKREYLVFIGNWRKISRRAKMFCKVRLYTLNAVNGALKIGFFHLLSANVILQIAGFGMQFFLTRLLTQKEIGYIAILQNFLVIMVLIAGFGISTSIVKMCSEKITDGKKQSLLLTGTKFNLITSIVFVTFVMVGTFFNLFSSSEAIVNWAMRVYILQLPFMILNELAMSYLKSQNLIKKMSSFQIITRSLVILMVIGCSFWKGFAGYLIGIVVANFISFLILLKVSLPNIKKIIFFKFEKVLLKEMIDYSKFAFVALIFYQLTQSIGVIMANYIIPGHEKEIGIFSIALLMMNGLIMIPSSYNQIMVPRLSNASDSLKDVKNLFMDYQSKMKAITIVLFVGSYFIVPYLIPVFFGAKYEPAILYFKVLVVGMVMWSIYSPIGNTLLSIGRVDLNVISNAISLIVLIVCNIIFLPIFGIMGLAYARIIMNVVGAIINYIMYKRVFKVV